MHLRQPVASLIGLLAIALAAGGCVLLESASESASASSDSASAVMESFSDSSESSSGEEEQEVEEGRTGEDLPGEARFRLSTARDETIGREERSQNEGGFEYVG